MKPGSVRKQRGSVLLETEENDQLFGLIGNRCHCLAAGVIQLYLTEPPHDKWIKRSTGIITLIRDTSERSLFLRLYCIQKRVMLWEHEVYDSVEYKAPLDYFHTFEAENCMVAFNFASKSDAIVFRSILVEELNVRAERRNGRHLKIEMENQRGVTPPRNQSISTPSSRLPNASDNFPNVSSMLISVNKIISNISMTKINKRRKQEIKKKLTTDDIGIPFDFRHVEHVELNINNCTIVDPTLKAFFNRVGIKKSHLKNEETRDFINNFIKNHGGMDAIQKEIVPSPVTQIITQKQVSEPQPQLESPAPVPDRTIPVCSNTTFDINRQRRALPLTTVQPGNRTPPPPPPNVPPVRKARPPRPRPPVIASAAASSAVAPSSLPPRHPPPRSMPAEQPNKILSNVPTPLPMPSLRSDPVETLNVRGKNGSKQATDPRSMLMESIRSGISLKKMDKEVTISAKTENRSTLLNEIRQGVTLKPIANEPRPTRATPNETEGLIGALRRALKNRLKEMYSESEDSSDFSDNDDEWDD
ncbi:hypothetical protein QAD02_018239 [Eretmocerus hayati]|uniref:Uncharacterized protein n=1 Tax=Eretmocerus hayati TaxID=131215 RepID=A0ACC2PGH2_9HYME|nr:hypothetical protein QAD02_018239 [Eretmocerus hayati]